MSYLQYINARRTKAAESLLLDPNIPITNDTLFINAETFTPGGKLVGRPTHIYLKKDLFTRTGNYGYYSFRYQSKNGAGNRERLHIWSDAYIAVSALQCEYKPITTKRNEILVIQEDVKDMKEF